MAHYFEEVSQKVEKYLKRYPNSPRKVALKLAWWNLVEAMRCQKLLDNEPAVTSASQVQADNRLRIALVGFGGMGDILIYINYLTYIRELARCRDVIIDLICENAVVPQSIADISLINGADNAYDSAWWFQHGPASNLDYDVILSLVRFPYFERFDRDKVAKFAPRLLPHFDAVSSVGRDYGKEWVHHSDAKVITWTRINGRKRINQFDVGGLLGMTASSRIKVPISADKEETLKKFDLSGRRFITVCREASMVNGESNTRLWTLDNCEQLIHMLKEEYGPKGFAIVQIGTTKHGTGRLSGVDVSLLDKTTLEELKILLKLSSLHVDTDAGMMHLRAALYGGKSVIVFGPTSKEVLGYPENINISSGACPHTCEWVIPDWYCKCVRGDHICMKALTAEMVMDRIRKEAGL